jgi:hypothetical protein
VKFAEVRLTPETTTAPAAMRDVGGVRLPPSRQALRRTAVALAEAGQPDLAPMARQGSDA